MRGVWGATVLVLLVAGDLAAGPSRDPRLAQVSPSTGGNVDWRQWDSFFTTVVKKLAEDLPEAQRDQLRDLFLDSRYQLVQSLSLGTPTYSAYNGGPRALGRYRTASIIPALKKVDEAFWTKFRAVSAGQELAVKSCYSN